MLFEIYSLTERMRISLLLQMFIQIKNSLFYGLCKTIKKSPQTQQTFCDAAETLSEQNIRITTFQMKRGIKYEGNIHIQGKVYAKRIYTGEVKALHELKLGGQEV